MSSPVFSKGDWVKLVADIPGTKYKAGNVGQVLTVFDSGDEAAYEVEIKSQFLAPLLPDSLAPIFEEGELTQASMGESLAAGTVHSFGTMIGSELSKKSGDLLAPDQPTGAPPQSNTPRPLATTTSDVGSNLGCLLLFLPFLFPGPRRAAGSVIKTVAMILVISFLLIMATVVLLLVFVPPKP